MFKIWRLGPPNTDLIEHVSGDTLRTKKTVTQTLNDRLLLENSSHEPRTVETRASENS